jgi:hypothetical protein
MKNFVLTIVVLALFIGCSQPSDTDNNGNNSNTSDSVNNEPIKTTVKIKNESSSDLFGVKWQDTYFPYDTASTDLSGYIFLNKRLGSNESLSLRTQELITAPHGEVFEFALTDNSVVIDRNNLNNIQSLGAIDRVLIPPYVTWAKKSGNNAITMRWSAVSMQLGIRSMKKTRFPAI